MNNCYPPFATDCEGAILIRIVYDFHRHDKYYILWAVFFKIILFDNSFMPIYNIYKSIRDGR